MRILALDTSAAAGSAALFEHGEVVVERPGDATRTHGERLPLELMAVLEAAGRTIADVDLFAVATGPGSFTGLRVGIATVQGLAFARRRTIVPVTTFEALALDPQPDGVTAIWIDAHRGEVFAALRDRDGHDLQPPSSRPPDETLAAWAASMPARPIRFVGDGAVRYRDRIAAVLGGEVTIEERLPLLAGRIARIAAAHPERAVIPHAVVPTYVRRPDAELARDRRKFD